MAADPMDDLRAAVDRFDAADERTRRPDQGWGMEQVALAYHLRIEASASVLEAIRTLLAASPEPERSEPSEQQYERAKTASGIPLWLATDGDVGRGATPPEPGWQPLYRRVPSVQTAPEPDDAGDSEPPEPEVSIPDLMAALEASVTAAKQARERQRDAGDSEQGRSDG